MVLVPIPVPRLLAKPFAFNIASISFGTLRLNCLAVMVNLCFKLFEMVIAVKPGLGILFSIRLGFRLKFYMKFR